MSERPEDALHALAGQLREENTVISPHVVDTDEPPALGLLVASLPRVASAPGEYARLVESIREGYLLHYGLARLLSGHDRDLALLAGDYLYANGLSRLASLGDLEAVRELSDLISLSAQLHAEHGASADELAPGLWLAAAGAIGGGRSDAYEAAKAAIRSGQSEASETLRAAALEARDAAGEGAFAQAAGAIGFAIPLG